MSRLAAAVPCYAQLAWWGLFKPRLVESGPLLVVQAVVRSERGVLLALRSEPRGWELPGGNPGPGESDGAALRREVREETGLELVVDRRVGDYNRTGFRPHTARVFACRSAGGALRPSDETPVLGWFHPREIPDTLLPWCRAPLADALSGRAAPVERVEHQGWSVLLASVSIDLRMRWSADRAGRRPASPAPGAPDPPSGGSPAGRSPPTPC